MAITSASTVADIEAAYLDNSDYEATQSVAKARLFMQACRALLLRRPARANRNTGDAALSFEWNVESIKTELDDCKRWLSFAPEAQADGGVTFPSFLESRDYDSGFTGGASLQEPYGDQV